MVIKKNTCHWNIICTPLELQKWTSHLQSTLETNGGLCLNLFSSIAQGL